MNQHNLLEVPYVTQCLPDACGVAALEMVYRYHRPSRLSKFDQRKVFERLREDCLASARQRVTSEKLVAVAVERGLSAGWGRLSSDPDQSEAQLTSMLDEQAIPLIVCQRMDDVSFQTGHYRVIVGLDGKTVVYHDPCPDKGGQELALPLRDFLDLSRPTPGGNVTGGVAIWIARKPLQEPAIARLAQSLDGLALVPSKLVLKLAMRLQNGDPEEGSVEWFEKARRRCVDDLRALLSIKIALGSIQALLRDWSGADAITKAALHSACVIAYGRPFTGSQSKIGKIRYPTKALKRAPGFDPELHNHLLWLRDKIIAHGDYDMFPSVMALQTAGKEKIPIQLEIRAKAMFGIERKELAGRYEKHLTSCAECLEASLNEAREKLKSVAKIHPDEFNKTHNIPEVAETPLTEQSGPLPPSSGPASRVVDPSFPEGFDGYQYITILDQTPMFDKAFTVEGMTFFFDKDD